MMDIDVVKEYLLELYSELTAFHVSRKASAGALTRWYEKLNDLDDLFLLMERNQSEIIWLKGAVLNALEPFEEDKEPDKYSKTDAEWKELLSTFDISRQYADHLRQVNRLFSRGEVRAMTFPTMFEWLYSERENWTQDVGRRMCAADASKRCKNASEAKSSAEKTAAKIGKSVSRVAEISGDLLADVKTFVGGTNRGSAPDGGMLWDQVALVEKAVDDMKRVAAGLLQRAREIMEVTLRRLNHEWGCCLEEKEIDPPKCDE